MKSSSVKKGCKVNVAILTLVFSFLLIISTSAEAGLWSKKITSEDLQKIISQLRIYDDPYSPSYNDVFRRNYTEARKLLDALNKEIQVSEELMKIMDVDIQEKKLDGLTYGEYILNAINERKLVEMGIKVNSPDQADGKFFGKLADDLSGWKSQLGQFLLEKILEGVFVAIGAPGLSIGVSTLGLATNLTTIGLGIGNLNKVWYEKALWFYIQLRKDLNYTHSEAWETLAEPYISRIVTLSPKKSEEIKKATEVCFKSLWEEYGEHILEDRIEEDFLAKQRKKLKVLFLYAIGAQPHLVITSPLKITPPPYSVGDEIKAEFTITNRGNLPIFLKTITAGGRYGDEEEIVDFTKRDDIKLDIGESYSYHGTLTLSKAGKYHFFCTYQTADGNWNPSIDLSTGLTDEDRVENITVEAQIVSSRLDIEKAIQAVQEIRPFFDLSTPENAIKSFYESMFLGKSENVKKCWSWRSRSFAEPLALMAKTVLNNVVEELIKKVPQEEQDPETLKRIYRELLASIHFEKEQIDSNSYYVTGIAKALSRIIEGKTLDTWKVVRENGNWKILLNKSWEKDERIMAAMKQKEAEVEKKTKETESIPLKTFYYKDEFAKYFAKYPDWSTSEIHIEKSSVGIVSEDAWISIAVFPRSPDEPSVIKMLIDEITFGTPKDIGFSQILKSKLLPNEDFIEAIIDPHLFRKFFGLPATEKKIHILAKVIRVTNETSFGALVTTLEEKWPDYQNIAKQIISSMKIEPIKKIPLQKMGRIWSSRPTPHSAIIGTEVGGEIITNTTWTKANSPYIISRDLVIQQGVSLIIEPGVIVKFNKGRFLQVNGELIARGTKVDPILFTSNVPDSKPGDWLGIFFSNTNLGANYDKLGNYVSGSKLEYCTIEYCKSAIKTESSSLFINHCVIQNNLDVGICVAKGSLKIVNSTIRQTQAGSGFYIKGATAAIIESKICHNNGECGGGIYAENATLDIIASTVEDNRFGECGGGIYAENATLNIIGTTISNNKGFPYSHEDDGGAIYAENCKTIIKGSFVTYNNGDYRGGIYIRGGSLVEIDGSTISNNTNNPALTGSQQIDIEKVGEVIMVGNTIESAGDGVIIEGSDKVVFVGNTLKHLDHAVYTYSVNSIVFTGNKIYDCREDVDLRSKNLVVKANVIANNKYGIYILDDNEEKPIFIKSPNVKLPNNWEQFIEESGLKSKISEIISPPKQPVNLFPKRGMSNISLSPTLKSSSFYSSDPEDMHVASEWQITRYGGYPPLFIFESGIDTSNLTTITIPPGILKASTCYYWRVRYLDSSGAWSDWSEFTHFQTAKEAS